MKKLITILLMVLSANFAFIPAMAQYPEWNDPNSLPKWMTPEEELRRHEIGEGFEATLAPQGQVRNIAEYERMQGVLIRYNNGLGIPMSLVVALSSHTRVITLASNNTQRNNAMNAYQAAGVNMTNVEFIIAGTNSIWTRDYGPLWIVDGNGQISALDFPYNRPRPLDNAVPGHLANHLGVPIYAMNVVHTGGNYMSTGWGIAASTDLVYEENGNNVNWVNQQMEDYAGIETYHVTMDPQGEYIKHIDCWAKFLDVDKILIAEVPPSHPQYWAYEQVTAYFASQTSAYETPFQIFRVYSPNGQPYTNSLILNHRVYVPTVNSTHDAAALAVYQQAMPGYEVLGFYSSSWQSTDALHCRVKEVADKNMLSVRHNPIHGLYDYQPEFEIQAEIIAHSGAEIYTDSLFLIYKANSGLLFDTVPMFHSEDHTFVGYIPASPGDTLITYYLSAADASGRKETWPLIGAPGARSFHVNSPADIVVSPDSLVFETVDQAYSEGLNLIIKNPSSIDLIVQEVFYNNGYGYFNPEPTLPYSIPAGDSLIISAFLFPGVTIRPDLYLYDSILVTSDIATHIVPVWVNPDLLGSVNEISLTVSSFNSFPNPFTSSIRFEFTLKESSHINLDIFDLQGRKIATLVDGMKFSGSHQTTWNARESGNLPEGVYIARMIAGSEVVTKRIILTR
jgi:agmatine deiminase